VARIGQAGWSRARIADGGPLVRQVASPTLVLEFAARFADGRLVVMPRTAHDLPASAIHDHVADFLDEDPGPTE
jgi:hypothetical protein